MRSPHQGAVRPWDVPLLLDIRQRGLLYATTALGLGAAVLSTLVGAPLGFALARVTLPFKPLLRVALAAPALFPTYVVALAWTYLVAPIAGEWAYSVVSAIVVMTVVCYPLSMLATEVALRRVEPRLEEAALLVARRAAVLRRITLPLAAPAMLAAALVIFVLAISEFGAPGVLRVRVFTTEVFTAFAALYDFRRAVVLALPLTAVSLVTATAAAILIRQRTLTTRRGMAEGTPVAFDSWRQPALVIILCVIVVGRCDAAGGARRRSTARGVNCSGCAGVASCGDQ